MKKILFYILFTCVYFLIFYFGYYFFSKQIKQNIFSEKYSIHIETADMFKIFLKDIEQHTEKLFEQYKTLNSGERIDFGNTEILSFPAPDSNVYFSEYKKGTTEIVVSDKIHLKKIFYKLNERTKNIFELEAVFVIKYFMNTFFSSVNEHFYVYSNGKSYPQNLNKKFNDIELNKSVIETKTKIIFIDKISVYDLYAISSYDKSQIYSTIAVIRKILIYLGSVVYILCFFYWKIISNAQIKLEKSNEKLSFLLTQTAHELKNPLSIIIAFSEQIIEGKIKNENIVKYIKKIYRTSKILELLVENSLNFSSLKELTINEEKIELFEFIDFLPKFDFIFQRSNDTVYINADTEKLKLILNNLLINGFKYAEDDNKKIYVEYDEEKVRLIVSDKGKGIVDVKNVFKLGFRENKQQNISGSGVGLFLVQKYVKMHNWKIDLITGKNKGCKFIITIPRIKNEEENENS